VMPKRVGPPSVVVDFLCAVRIPVFAPELEPSIPLPQYVAKRLHPSMEAAGFAAQSLPRPASPSPEGVVL